MDALYERLLAGEKVMIAHYLFRMVNERIVVIYPIEDGMCQITFPALIDCENWINEQSELAICDTCGEIISKIGVVEDEDLNLCSDCLKEYLDASYGKGVWEEAYSYNDNTFYEAYNMPIEGVYLTDVEEAWIEPAWYSLHKREIKEE